jgi:hypothetical protein
VCVYTWSLLYAHLFYMFCFNFICQYTPLPNLCPLIFSLTCFGCLCCIMLTPTYFIIYCGNILFLFMCTISGTHLRCKTRAWFTYVYRCAQILGTRCPKWMSSFWSPEFIGGSQILGKFVYPFICIYIYTQTMVVLPIGQ